MFGVLYVLYKDYTILMQQIKLDWENGFKFEFDGDRDIVRTTSDTGMYQFRMREVIFQDRRYLSFQKGEHMLNLINTAEFINTGNPYQSNDLRRMN